MLTERINLLILFVIENGQQYNFWQKLPHLQVTVITTII